MKDSNTLKGVARSVPFDGAHIVPHRPDVPTGMSLREGTYLRAQRLARRHGADPRRLLAWGQAADGRVVIITAEGKKYAE